MRKEYRIPENNEILEGLHVGLQIKKEEDKRRRREKDDTGPLCLGWKSCTVPAVP